MRGKFAWLYELEEIDGVLLVGSHARNTASADSDVDLVILTSDVQSLLEDTSWAGVRGEVDRADVEDWGRVTSLRAHYRDGFEVEYGLTSPAWADLAPIDDGTVEVVRDGAKILYDPKGILSALLYKISKLHGTLLEPRTVVPTALAEDLVADQFPQWAELPVSPVKAAGWCNAAFRLGDEYLVRIPRAQRYEKSHILESEWLPKLSRRVASRIPEPAELGRPSNLFPWHWSVYRWIEGESAESIDARHLVPLARDLAAFLREMHAAEASDGPACWDQNFYRGAPLYVYDEEAKQAAEKLEDVVDYDAVMGVWEFALSSSWKGDSVWVHGDVSPANLLVQDGRLRAVLDFGNMCVGDPACDLVIAWTFFEGESRHAFVKSLGLDAETWERARGWALWKALICLDSMEDVHSDEARSRLRLLEALINEKPNSPVAPPFRRP